MKMKKLFAALACVVVLGASQASALSPFCHDNTDKLIVKLKKVQLTTEQLKDVFAYQAEHRGLIAASHSDGQGCRVHENHEVTFEKQSIGVLSDKQFKSFKGRVRNENETLRYENYLLEKEVARMKKELEALKAQVAALAAASR
jgi:hypothetical protein